MRRRRKGKRKINAGRTSSIKAEGTNKSVKTDNSKRKQAVVGAEIKKEEVVEADYDENHENNKGRRRVGVADKHHKQASSGGRQRSNGKKRRWQG
jgi:hypothetical protein